VFENNFVIESIEKKNTNKNIDNMRYNAGTGDKLSHISEVVTVYLDLYIV